MTDDYALEDDTPRNETEAFHQFAEHKLRQLETMQVWNPVHVWEVIARATAQNGSYHELPDWVRDYLDRVAEGMIAETKVNPADAKSVGAVLPDIMFMSKRGWNPFKDYAADKRREKLRNSVFLLSVTVESPSERKSEIAKLSRVHAPRARQRLIKESLTGTKRSRIRQRQADQT